MRARLLAGCLFLVACSEPPSPAASAPAIAESPPTSGAGYGEAAERADTVTLISDPPGTEVAMDGVLIGMTPLALPAPSSPLTLTLRDPGHADTTVTIGPATPAQLRVTLTPRSAAPEAAAETVDEPSAPPATYADLVSRGILQCRDGRCLVDPRLAGMRAEAVTAELGPATERSVTATSATGVVEWWTHRYEDRSGRATLELRMADRRVREIRATYEDLPELVD